MRVINPVNGLLRIGWFLSAERISWFILFPLALYLGYHDRWILGGLCLVASTGIVIIRGTVNNVRAGFRYRLLINQQYARDDEAKACLRALRSGGRQRRPVVLFLRPFAGDTRIKLRDFSTPDGYDVMSLESRLVSSFARWATTVSFRAPMQTGRDLWGDMYAEMPPDVTIGDPDFYKYEGRLFYTRPGEIAVPDPEWFDSFRLVARNADLIVSVPVDATVAPGSSATILELLDLRTNGLLERCLFVMPPEQELWLMRPDDETPERRGTAKSWGTQPFMLSGLWESARGKLAQGGFPLPPFSDQGGDNATLFVLRDGEPVIADVPRSYLSRPRSYLALLGIALSKRHRGATVQ